MKSPRPKSSDEWFEAGNERLTKELREELKRRPKQETKIALILLVGIGAFMTPVALLLVLMAYIESDKVGIVAYLGVTFMGVIWVVLAGWHLVVEMRKHSTTDQEETNLDVETAGLEAQTKRQLTPIKAEDEIGQFDEAKSKKESQEQAIREVETQKLKQEKLESKDE